MFGPLPVLCVNINPSRCPLSWPHTVPRQHHSCVYASCTDGRIAVGGHGLQCDWGLARNGLDSAVSAGDRGL